MMDFELIDEFRNKVNERDFVLFKYRDVNGKDQWSCICSAMDWITVSMEYIADVKSGKRGYQQSMEMYAYISSIDVVWEAVQQLHRVFFQTAKIPFNDEHECFVDRILNQDDNRYFKTIRASFGAHPVNLDGEEKNEKFFASWSGAFLGGDYNVLLYSNKVGKGFRTMRLRVEELNKFLEKRYNHLNQLMHEIDRQYEQFKNEMIKIPIMQTSDVCDQLQILREESRKRLDLSYFNYIIDSLIRIFANKITNKENEKMVTEYRKLLMPMIDILYNSLQNMELKGFDDDILHQTSDKLSNGYGYYISKLTDYIYGAGYHPMVWEERLREIFKGYFIMEYSSYEELYVLILACISKLHQNAR